MSLCIFSRCAVILAKDPKKALLPGISLTSLGVLLIFLIRFQTGVNQIELTTQLLQNPKLLHTKTPCNSSEQEVVINLGTVYLSSKHCIVFCTNTGTYGVFNCQDPTRFWIRQKVIMLNGTENHFETDCSSYYYSELCRIPIVLAVLHKEQGWSC